MGLAIAPRLRFLQKQQTKQQAMQQQKASLCPQVVTDFLHGISAAGQADAPRKRTKKAADNVNVPTGAAAAGKDTVALTFDLDVDLDDVLTLKKRAKPQESSDSDEEKVVSFCKPRHLLIISLNGIIITGKPLDFRCAIDISVKI